jgi:hypothetical protein
MAKPPARFKYNEVTRRVTVIRKKKGARKPEEVTIQVTVRSSNRTALNRSDVRHLIEQAFGPEPDQKSVTHEHKRHIDKK